MQERFKGVHAKRHPLWGQEQFLSDLQRYRSIKKVCEIYASKETGWRGLYNDYWRWRRADPKFGAMVDKIVNAKGTKRAPGRPRKDGGDESWKQAYCRVLVETNGNEEKARAETPYSIRQIQEFKSLGSTSYDEEFATMLEEAWAKVAAPNQEAAFGTIHKLAELDLDAEESFYKAKTLETIHRVAVKSIEKLDPSRYGNKLNVAGRVDHVHSQERYLSPGEMVARLLEDRQKFLELRQQQGALLLSSGEVKEPVDDAVDVEVVDGA